MSTSPTPDLDADPFDALLGLEEEYYREGHALGVADGSRAGRVEGRVFGLERGFDKFMAMGALHGKAVVWGARMPGMGKDNANANANANAKMEMETKPASGAGDGGERADADADAGQESVSAQDPSPLPPLAPNPRLEKHIATLFALAEPASLSTQNDEESVSDFDDRLKRALAKEKVIQALIREEGGGKMAAAGSRGGDEAAKKRGGGRGVKVAGAEGAERNMEDFGGRGGRA